MKRKILQCLTLLLLLIVAAISCKKEPVDGITLDKTLTIYVGKVATLTVTFIPRTATNKKISWESSDPNVAIVKNGKVTGIEIGKTIITAISQDGDRRAQCIVYVIQPIAPEMVWVEGGTFSMGCTEELGEDCRMNELPVHQVTVSGFYIGKYEVTQKEWVAAMGTNPSYEGIYTGDDKPVHCMTFYDVQGYIAKLNAYTDKNYRLPTEAEWEFAARGGNKSHGYKYSGSNNIDEVAWYSNNSNGYPHSVGTKKPNELGIYDMSGNLNEWCSDWYGTYSNTPQTNPIGPDTGSYHVGRGGAWVSSANSHRVSIRGTGVLPEWRSCIVSFRLVLSAEKKKE